MANNRTIIAIGHRPPHGSLRIVAVAGYELAVLPGEDVRALVEAAESALDESDRRPWLREPDSVEDLCEST